MWPGPVDQRGSNCNSEFFCIIMIPIFHPKFCNSFMAFILLINLGVLCSYEFIECSGFKLKAGIILLEGGIFFILFIFVLFDLISNIPLLSLINFFKKKSINPVISSNAKLSQSQPEKKQIYKHRQSGNYSQTQNKCHAQSLTHTLTNTHRHRHTV